MMVIDAAALVAVLGVAVWAGLPRPSDEPESGGFAYWGHLPGDGDSSAAAPQQMRAS